MRIDTGADVVDVLFAAGTAEEEVVVAATDAGAAAAGSAGGAEGAPGPGALTFTAIIMASTDPFLFGTSSLMIWPLHMICYLFLFLLGLILKNSPPPFRLSAPKWAAYPRVLVHLLPERYTMAPGFALPRAQGKSAAWSASLFFRLGHELCLHSLNTSPSHSGARLFCSVTQLVVYSQIPARWTITAAAQL
jgi:hypothetical protein